LTEILWTAEKTKKTKRFREIVFASPGTLHEEMVFGGRKRRPYSPAGAQELPGVAHGRDVQRGRPGLRPGRSGKP